MMEGARGGFGLASAMRRWVEGEIVKAFKQRCHLKRQNLQGFKSSLWERTGNRWQRIFVLGHRRKPNGTSWCDGIKIKAVVGCGLKGVKEALRKFG
jgi:hypothetical protein